MNESSPAHVGENAPRRPRQRFWVRLALGALAALGVVAGLSTLAAVPPTPDSWYPKCTLHSATGMHCPGCGITRALHALLNGQLTQAFAYNALIFFVLPTLAWAQFRRWTGGARAAPARPVRRAHWWPWLILGLILTFGLTRNLPWYPFTLLAPHVLGSPS